MTLPRVVSIIQARNGSTRLPGKVLADLGDGRTLLAHVIERALVIRGVDEVIVATSTLDEDDRVAREAHECDVNVVRGSATDVLDRYREAATETDADVIMRLTADCPFLDPDVAQRVLGAFLVARLGGAVPHPGVVATPGVTHVTHFLSNATPPHRTYPDGLDVEVFTDELLEAAWLTVTDPAEREHVTPGMGRLATLRVLRQTPDRSADRWTVDTPEDLAWVQRVRAHLPPEAYTQADTYAAIVASGMGYRRVTPDGIVESGRVGVTA